MQMRENTSDNKGAKGGVLADDPGLGKTVTVMSCVVSRLGLMSRRGFEVKAGNDLFRVFYEESFNKELRRGELRGVVEEVRKFCDKMCNYYDVFVSRDPLFDLEDYKIAVGEGVWLDKVMEDAEEGKYGGEVEGWRMLKADVRKVFENGKIWSPADAHIQDICDKCLSHSSRVFEAFERQVVKNARRSRHGWDSETGRMVRDANDKRRR